jgi:hypothetical protein
MSYLLKMRWLNPWMALAAAGCWPVGIMAQARLLPDSAPQQVFAGEMREIALRWHNPGEKTATAEVRARIFQASSATVMPLAEKPWKRIDILPGQTVLETAAVDFPAVRAETRFLIQWLEAPDHILGLTEVCVYPTNLLQNLKALLGENVLGVLDPGNGLKPLLRQNGIEFEDLSEMSLEGFQGKLAIIGPFLSPTQVREGLAGRIKRMARKGAAVVWLQAPPGARDRIKPSFYLVPEGNGAIVVVQPDMTDRLAQNPRSQLNLIYFCEWVLNPVAPALPNLISAS